MGDHWGCTYAPIDEDSGFVKKKTSLHMADCSALPDLAESNWEWVDLGPVASNHALADPFSRMGRIQIKSNGNNKKCWTVYVNPNKPPQKAKRAFIHKCDEAKSEQQVFVYHRGMLMIESHPEQCVMRKNSNSKIYFKPCT